MTHIMRQYLTKKENDLINPTLNQQVIKNVINDLKAIMVFSKTNEEWFDSIKEVATKNDFALSKKDIKQNPDKYHGSVADVAEILRIALTGSKKSPNLHDVIEILGREQVERRLDFIVANILNK